MLDKVEEFSLQVSHMISSLGLFQVFFSFLRTLMWLALKLSCGLSVPYMVCLFYSLLSRRMSNNQAFCENS